MKHIAMVLLGCYGMVSRVIVNETHCYGVARVLWVGFQGDC